MMENWNHDKNPESYPMYLMVVLGVMAIMMLVVVLMFGCGTQPSLDSPDAILSGADLGNNELGEQFYTPDPGSLPLGFNERGCQWDGCTGPPDRRIFVSNPVESQP